ncbi:hypothetical protein ACOI1H_23100 [Loktanella sp. DJP18]|uniref:hypothetical protein n=1 Tax=Loktanella sp. DJP18 TaxID=3409788 RepID=UPI003BB8028A
MTLRLRSIIQNMLRGSVSALGVFRRIAIFLVVLGMLALNIASFAFEQVGAIFSTLADSIFHTSWVAEVSEDATAVRSRAKAIDVENDRLRNANLELETRNRRLASNLDGAAATLRRQADEIAGARELRSQFDQIGSRISRRIATGGARNIASIPLESAPFVGALTVTVVTAAEVYDACQTFEEMQQLRELAGFDRLENIMAKTCNYVPFVGGEISVKEMSVSECFNQSQSLIEIDKAASDALIEKCECIQANPSREAICFPESTRIEIIDDLPNEKPDRQ